MKAWITFISPILPNHTTPFISLISHTSKYTKNLLSLQKTCLENHVYFLISFSFFFLNDESTHTTLHITPMLLVHPLLSGTSILVIHMSVFYILCYLDFPFLLQITIIHFLHLLSNGTIVQTFSTRFFFSKQ